MQHANPRLLLFLRNSGVWIYFSFAAGHNSKIVFYIVLKMLAMKGLSNFETAEVIKGCIFS